MGYKIKGALQKSKPAIIIGIILWVLLSIVLIVPLTVSIVESSTDGTTNIQTCFDVFFDCVGDFSTNFSKVFTKDYIKSFEKNEAILALIILFISIIGMIKAMPKNEYSDIEHGSSDWAKGEEYKVLSKTKGILLAEKHYLPVDKRGNTNVLVVGRFWFW